MFTIVQGATMVKILLLIFLFYVGRFIVRFVYPTYKAFHAVKKKMNERTAPNQEPKKESLYENKGEYIDYEEIS